MAVIGGVILVLMILYQCLKAGMFFKTEPPADRPDEKDYAELGEAYGTETDDDYLGPSSKATSRRSSFNTSGSKSDMDLALGDSASVYERYSDGEYSPSGGGRALSAYGDIRGGAEGEFLSTAGRLQISASYAPTAQKLAVTVVRAEDIPTKQRGGSATVQVHVVLLPSKRQRKKTKWKSSSNPNFHESFTFDRVSSSEVHDCSLRFRLYGHERIGRHKMIGELNVGLTELDLDGEGTSIWRTLTPRNALTVSTQFIFPFVFCYLSCLVFSRPTGVRIHFVSCHWLAATRCQLIFSLHRCFRSKYLITLFLSCSEVLPKFDKRPIFKNPPANPTISEILEPLIRQDT